MKSCEVPRERGRVDIAAELVPKTQYHREVQFTLPNLWKLASISHHVNMNGIISKSGGPDQYRKAVNLWRATCLRQSILQKAFTGNL